MKRILFSVIFVSLLLMGGCKDQDLTEEQQLNEYVNKWLYDNMDGLYYWNTKLPAYKSNMASPADYFKTLKYKDDRFSAIFESYQDIQKQLNGVSSAEIGFEFQLWKENDVNVLGVVTYVKHGTPAEKMGIKRGDIFRKINGEQLTMSNYSTVINYLFNEVSVASIIFATYNNGAFYDKAPVIVTKVTNYVEDPIYLDTVYTVNNKKVGYLVYNFFTNDPGDKTMKYDLELNSAIGQFKQQNISELIVDLRYNHGGMMSSAIHFASMLVPNLASDKVFNYTEYNKNYTDYFNSSEFKSQDSSNPFVDNFTTSITSTTTGTALAPVQNVGNSLSRIFFLTGKGTASASEMVINGIRPFLTTVLVGDTTVGKNVGSTLVNDTKNTKNQWAFMPIVLKYFNKDHQSDFTKGFAPNYLVADDYSYALGDIHEGLLAKAISHIFGMGVSPAKVAFVKRVQLKSSIDFKPAHSGLVIRNRSIDSYLKSKME